MRKIRRNPPSCFDCRFNRIKMKHSQIAFRNEQNSGGVFWSNNIKILCRFVFLFQYLWWCLMSVSMSRSPLQRREEHNQHKWNLPWICWKQVIYNKKQTKLISATLSIDRNNNSSVTCLSSKFYYKNESYMIGRNCGRNICINLLIISEFPIILYASRCCFLL